MPHFSEAAKRNSGPILEKLRAVLIDGDTVLEIASGTGQHALHVSINWPQIIWQPSDVDLHAYGLSETIEEQAPQNVRSPLELDIQKWPDLREEFDAVFSANCLHTVPESFLKPYIEGAARSLRPAGWMMLYGPFKYEGAFTTPSNAEFDGFLRERYPGGGIRDFEAIDALAKASGFSLVSDEAMPANNRFIVWRKR